MVKIIIFQKLKSFQKIWFEIDRLIHPLSQALEKSLFISFYKLYIIFDISFLENKND